MQRKRALVALAVAAGLAAGVLTVVWWQDDAACHSDLGQPESTDGVSVERLTSGKIAEPPESLPQFELADYAEQVTALAAAPGGSVLGELTALYRGTFDRETLSWEVPTLVGLRGSDLIVASSGGLPGLPWQSAVAAVNLDGNGKSLRWARSFEGNALGGGVVGDRLVTLGIPEDRAPEVASINLVNGDVAWCYRVGADTETPWMPPLDGSRTADGDLIVTRFITDEEGDQLRGAQTVRIDAETGDVRWEVTDDEPNVVRNQDVLGDLVIQSSAGEDGGGPTPQMSFDGNCELQPSSSPVIARNVADGRVAWKYAPRTGKDTNAGQFVIGATEDRVLIAQGLGVAAEPKATEQVCADVRYEGRLVALDRTGRTVWEHDVDYEALRDNVASAFTVAGDLLIGQTKGQLRAWRLGDGSVAWQSAGAGLDLRRAVAVDGRLLVPGSGLSEVDLDTGNVERVLQDELRIGEVLVDDGQVVLDTEVGVAVFARQPGANPER